MPESKSVVSWVRDEERLSGKGCKGILRGWKFTYLYFSGGYMGLCICQNSLNCILKIDVILCFNGLIFFLNHP